MIDIFMDDITVDGVRRLQLVSDAVITAETRLPVVLPVGAVVRRWSDAMLGLHYLEATWACREVVTVRLEGMLRPRRLAVWKLLPGDRVSEIAGHVAEWYFAAAHQKPQYAFMKRLPAGVENGQRLSLDGYELDLFETEWALTGCLMVGG